jgi:hypothetical protein
VLRLGANEDAWSESGIKGDKTALVPDGQAQQVTVSDLSVAEQMVPVEVFHIQQALVVCNEGVPGVRQGLRKTLCNGLQWQGLRVRRLRHDAQAPVLSEGARDSAVFNFLFKPMACMLVVNVPSIQQSTHQMPSASRRRLMRSLVTITPLDGKGSNPVMEGLSWSFAAGPELPVSACLKSSETTLPTPTCFWRTISLAALSMSILKSRVVRMLSFVMWRHCIMMKSHHGDVHLVKKPSDKAYVRPLWGQVYWPLPCSGSGICSPNSLIQPTWRAGTPTMRA